MDDILQCDATEQLTALYARRVSASELLQAAFDRADQVNPVINAVVARDAERAIADAATVDAARAHGEALGVLAGLPVTVKDIFDIEGLTTRARRRLGGCRCRTVAAFATLNRPTGSPWPSCATCP